MARQDALAYSAIPTSDVRRRVVERCFPDEEERDVISTQDLNRCIQRVRQNARPDEPTSMADPLDHAWLTEHCPTLKVVLDHQGRDGSTIRAFCTSFHMEYLSEAQMWFLDGTFKVIMGLRRLCV